MSCLDYIRVKCIKCKNDTVSQTKILGNNSLSTYAEGCKIKNKEFFNTILELKNKCICSSKIVIIIKNGEIIGTTKEAPEYKELLFGIYKKIN